MTRIVMNVQDGSVTETELTAEELAAIEANKLTPEYIAQEAAAALAQSKLTGVLIEGVMCSATKEDQNGLAAVALAVTIARMNAATLPDTRFEFANGNELVITDANFDTVYTSWMTFRQSFFAA